MSKLSPNFIFMGNCARDRQKIEVDVKDKIIKTILVEQVKNLPANNNWPRICSK